LEKTSPYRFLPQIDHHHGQHDRAELFDPRPRHASPRSIPARDPLFASSLRRSSRATARSPAGQTAGPTTSQCRTANETRANSTRTPVRPSVSQVTHKAVGSKINSVDASAKTSTGRLAPGMTPWKPRTGIDKKQPLRPSTITKNPARGRRATDRNNGAIKWFAVSGTANGRAKQRPATGLLAGHPGDDSSDQNLYRVRLSHQGRVPSVYQIMILNPKKGATSRSTTHCASGPAGERTPPGLGDLPKPVYEKARSLCCTLPNSPTAQLPPPAVSRLGPKSQVWSEIRYAVIQTLAELRLTVQPRSCA
jgi:hypothetical protein